MLIYGPPTSQTTNSGPFHVLHIQRARRAIAAAEGSTGWRRQSYLQSAIEHLSDAERSVLRTGEGGEDLVRVTAKFASVATPTEYDAAIAKVIRGYGSNVIVLKLHLH